MLAATRAFKRFSFDAIGFLQVEDERLSIQTVDVSANGACIRTPEESWLKVEELDTLNGRLNLGGQDFNFKARVCWSAAENTQDGEDDRTFVRFGLEFIESDAEVIESVLESNSIITEDDTSMDSFNI